MDPSLSLRVSNEMKSVENTAKSWMWWHMPVNPNGSYCQPGQFSETISKKKIKKARDVAQWKSTPGFNL